MKATKSQFQILQLISIHKIKCFSLVVVCFWVLDLAQLTQMPAAEYSYSSHDGDWPIVATIYLP